MPTLSRARVVPGLFLRLTGHALFCLALLTWRPAETSPMEPPMPRHCRDSCRVGNNCLPKCREAWDRLPWREKIVREYPKAGKCLEREKSCVKACGRTKGSDRCTITCRHSLVSCARTIMGIDPAKVDLCWRKRRLQTKRCTKLEGRRGWGCQHTALAAFYSCARRACRKCNYTSTEKNFIPWDEQERILLEIEERMSNEGATLSIREDAP